MRKLIYVAVFSLTGLSQAHAATIDFEEFSSGPPDMFTPLQSNGFDVTGFIREGIFGPPEGFDVFTGSNGTNVAGGSISAVGQDGFGAAVYVTVERTDGAAFSLLDADYLGTTDPNGYVGAYGQLAGGGIVNLDDQAFGTGAWLNIVSATFRAEGDGFSFSDASLEVDNIVTGAAVPVPAAVWLFGSGLGLLGWYRRRGPLAA